MIRWVGFAGLLVAGSALASGLLMAYARRARLAGWLLAAAGLLALLGAWLVDGDATVTLGQVLLVAAGMVLFPAALWAYPRPRWQHPVDMLLGVALVGPGLLACLYTGDPAVFSALGMAAVLALVAQTWWRLERSDEVDRWALTWVALTITVVGLASLTLLFVAWDTGVPGFAVAMLALVPVSMAVGVLRPDTVDVRGLVVSASVALALVIGYWAYFVGALAVLEVLGAGQPQPTVLAALGLLGGVMLHPASSALRAVMDQLLFGERPDPLDAATRVVGRIGEDPEEALRSLREDLAVPYVALWRGTRLVAQSGEPVHHVRRIVTHSGEAEEATLVVGMRAGDLRLSVG